MSIFNSNKSKLVVGSLLMLTFQMSTLAQKMKAPEYVSAFQKYAVAEMKRTGVPAAISLAQGLLETEIGNGVLYKKSKNHFGIKCKNDWTGEVIDHDDDAPGECFRVYPTDSASYSDHSNFLRSRPHYASLFELDPLDYKSWSYGLKKAGYATNPKYPGLLIALIEKYGLQKYSEVGMSDSLVANISGHSQKESTLKNNNAVETSSAKEKIVHTVLQQEGLYSISKKYGVSVNQIMQWNGLESDKLSIGQQLYILK